VGVPLGILASYQFSADLAGRIDIDVSSYLPPAYVFGIEGAVGRTVPVLAGLYPVLAGTRVTVREALTAERFDATPGQRDWIDRAAGSVRGLPRPPLISLRNPFRRQGRLALTLSTLTLAGATFVAVVSVWQSTAPTISFIRQTVQSQFDIIVVLLLVMAAPLGVVGGLGASD
jgi:putative ABC transport system permease protein